ncbi:transposase [Tetragenococcus halophilus]|uniref:Transposase n=1 Tax=Tetragenococcus halophilus TaxID=51669 RepID=A0AB37D1F5_TETHA|nr:transposase [Tetragenococcus halophilus]QGP75682.1 transposase [Tetragenococcus halophilus]QGP76682.1 transposase [Tetragenococcus halophilus]
MSIITSNNQNKNEISSSIDTFFQRFNVSTIAKKSNAQKEKGVNFLVLFRYLVTTLFSNRSAFRDFQLHQEELGFSDKTFRNLLNNGKINWQRFLILLSKQVIAFIRPLTEKDRKEVFIVDDSMYERLNAKNVELCGWQYDHTDHKNKKGFRFLQLGWSDGNTFLPVAFSLLSASKKVREVEKIDHRTHAGRRKAQAQRKGTDVLIELLQAALKEGIQAKYMLFDSWFSSPKMFHALRGLNLHAVCMVKRSKKVYYRYHGEWVDVKTIFQIEKKRRGRSRYLLSVCVESELEGKILPIKLVYVRNRNKRNDYLVLATTDLSLNEDEIIQLYGKRWSIEVYFKICKQHLRLAKYQGLSYDGIFAHTITVAVSYLILAVQHREQADERTMGELFYLMIEELSDISFSEAIVQLLELFKEVFANEMILSEETLNNIMSQFIQKLPQSTQRQLKKVA